MIGVSLPEFSPDGFPNADDPRLVRGLRSVIDFLHSRGADAVSLSERFALSDWLLRANVGDLQPSADGASLHLLLYLRGSVAYNNIDAGRQYGPRRAQIRGDGGEYPFHQVVVFARRPYDP